MHARTRIAATSSAAFAFACGPSSVPPSSNGAASNGPIASPCSATARPHSGPFTAVSVQGDTGSTEGIFDPSLAYPAGASEGFMSYSSVPSQGGVHTRVATSNDQGASWRYVGDVNVSAPASIQTTDPAVCLAASCAGTWVHEVSSIVLDPSDPDSARAFKVFAHTYFVSTADALHYEIGYISLYTAGAAAGPWTESKTIGWNSSSTASSAGAAQNASTDPSLAGASSCVVLTEPGALVHRTAAAGGAAAISLSLGCVRPAASGTVIEVVLLRTTDHAKSWTFVSTLLDETDAVALGAVRHQLNAPDLFVIGGTTYLFVTPDGNVATASGTADGYRGCLSFEVDIEAGRVSRCGAELRAVTEYLGAPEQFLGACTAAEGASALGVIVPTASLRGASPSFEIEASHSGPP